MDGEDRFWLGVSGVDVFVRLALCRLKSFSPQLKQVLLLE